jgi:hypothetical protein
MASDGPVGIFDIHTRGEHGKEQGHYRGFASEKGDRAENN